METDTEIETETEKERHVFCFCVSLFLSFIFGLGCSPEMLPFFWGGIVLKMKSLSNLIFKTIANGIMFDRDFILKMMPPKKNCGSIFGNFTPENYNFWHLVVKNKLSSKIHFSIPNLNFKTFQNLNGSDWSRTVAFSHLKIHYQNTPICLLLFLKLKLSLF